MRYAGYVIVFLLFVLPFIYLIINKINLRDKKIIKKISILLTISFIIFFIKNSNRVFNELNVKADSHHNFENFPFYWVKKTHYKKVTHDDQILYQTSGKCWNTPSVCVRSLDNLKITKYKNYIFYSTR